ncbi:MAG: AAA family ATPase [Mycobacterium sp.]
MRVQRLLRTRRPAQIIVSVTATDRPEVRETHSGLVVLVGDRAYKTKRPVRTEFLDFSTPALRERACRREVELNSRLAPAAYLGIAHLTGPGPGEREPVVVMRRYPDAARLSNRLDGSAIDDELRSVAGVLARFHAAARRGPEIDTAAGATALAGLWRESIDDMRRFVDWVLPDADLDLVAALSGRYLAGCAGLFAARVADRRIVDGHGDLLADDIFWSGDGPMLLDCLDFDDRLRYLDGIDDAAFLAMDLEFHGRPDLAQQFLADYRAAAGDPAPASLADFYIGYRALVRAKVDCIRVEQGHPAAAADAQRHLRIAGAHLCAAVPRLVLVGGGPGTGKSTLSRALAEHVGAMVISTDDVRRELVAAGALDGAPGAVGAGLYAPEKVAAVYREVLRRAGAALSGGLSVILDGTWRDAAQRAAAGELAQGHGAALLDLVCEIPLAAAQQRITGRVGGTSDATVEVAEALAAGAVGRERPGALRVDTGRPIGELVHEIGRRYRGCVAGDSGEPDWGPHAPTGDGPAAIR